MVISFIIKSSFVDNVALVAPRLPGDGSCCWLFVLDLSRASATG